MPNTFSCTLVLMLCLCTMFKEGLFQASFTPNSQHPDHPGSCYYEGPPAVFIKKGQSKRVVNECYSISCDNNYALTRIGCGIQAETGHCRLIKGDLSKPHPYCCDKFIC